MRCIFAFDIGGTSLKGALISAQGQTVAFDSFGQKPPVPDIGGCCEIDPEELWQHFKKVTGSVLSKPETTGIQIDGIVIAGLTRTQIFLNKDGKSIRPAITWADSRARRQADQVVATVKKLGPQAKTSGPINAYHTLARLRWLLEEEPHHFDSLYCVLEPKDYLNFRLTGKLAGDTISLARLMSIADMELSTALFTQLDLPAEIIPPLMEPQQRLGSVLSRLEAPFDRLSGLPVFVGGMDAWCACLGLGALQAKYAYNISGTSEVMGVISNSYEEIPGLITLPWHQGFYQVGGPSQAGADCLLWYQQTFENSEQGVDPGTLIAQLEKRQRQPEPILFLPYLRGERTPLWDPDVRSLFFGINRRHRSTDFIWAVLEGVAFAGRQILELATKSQHETLREVRIGGGAARSELWCQIKSSIWKQPVTRMKAEESALLGAAMVGYYGLGEYSSLSETQKAMAELDRTFEPDCGPWRQRSQLYDRLYEHFLEIQTTFLPISRSFVQTITQSLAHTPQTQDYVQ